MCDDLIPFFCVHCTLQGKLPPLPLSPGLKVMGQILPGVPVWSMANDSRWPGLPLVVFPGNVGGKETLVEAMDKVRPTDGCEIVLVFDAPATL